MILIVQVKNWALERLSNLLRINYYAAKSWEIKTWVNNLCVSSWKSHTNNKDWGTVIQKSYDKPRQCIKKQRHYFAKKGLYSQSYDFFQ